MALEAVVYPQDPFGYVSCKDILFQDFYFQEEQDGDTKINIKQGQERDDFIGNHFTNHTTDHDRATEDHQWQDHQSPLIPSLEGLGPLAMNHHPPPPSVAEVAAGGRRKRRRTRNSKNKDEIENQRMTHIAVERNRRKQMNEYLSVLRSLMPPSYAQRGDQASIIGGAINYVKELEHLLQSMEPKKKVQSNDVVVAEDNNTASSSSSSAPFSDFFTFPQYSSRSSATSPAAEGTAEIEVTMVESHANLKILSKKRPRQLLKLVSAIQSLRLTLLHLNVTTLDHSVLYSISVKVEEGSQVNSVDDIASAVNQILKRIEEESTFS